jgi:hypothetical protein
MDQELRAIGECYPSNVWYNSLDDEDGGGTVWQGEGFWKLHEMRSNFERCKKMLKEIKKLRI